MELYMIVLLIFGFFVGIMFGFLFSIDGDPDRNYILRYDTGSRVDFIFLRSRRTARELKNEFVRIFKEVSAEVAVEVEIDPSRVEVYCLDDLPDEAEFTSVRKEQ